MFYIIKSINKRLIIIITSILVFLFLSPRPALAYTEVRDQYYHGICCEMDPLYDGNNFPMYQTFTPSLNKLTKIRLEFYGGGGPDPLIIYLCDSGANRLASATTPIDEGWYSFVFSSAISITPGQSYRIEYSRLGTASLGAAYNDPANYSGGYAITSGVSYPTKDYHFETYGYNTSDPAPVNGQEQSENGQEDSDEPQSSSQAEEEVEEEVEEELEKVESILPLIGLGEELETEKMDWISILSLGLLGIAGVGFLAYWSWTNAKWPFGEKRKMFEKYPGGPPIKSFARRVVLDTNLVIAAYYNKKSASAQILDLAKSGKIKIFSSLAVNQEMERILNNIKANFKFRRFIKTVIMNNIVRPKIKLNLVKDDPEDNKLLEVAKTAKTGYLISNDKHLLKLKKFEKTKIVKSVKFIKIFTD